MHYKFKNVYKLAMLLDEVEHRGIQPPLTYIGILYNNNARHRYAREGLHKTSGAILKCTDVRILRFPEPTAHQ